LHLTPNRPFHETQSDLFISQDKDGANCEQIEVYRSIDPISNALFTVESFGLDCTYGNVCSVIPVVNGDYPLEWAGESFSVEWGLRERGKGKFKTPFGSVEGQLSEPLDFSNLSDEFGGVKVPTELRAIVTYRSKKYSMVTLVLPKPALNLSAPGSAIVGFNFSVLISSTKNYSGTCSVNGFQVAIKNGAGKIVLYGKKPGNLRLTLNCNSSSNWAATSVGRDIYIRN
jgi:hypothetical protein